MEMFQEEYRARVHSNSSRECRQSSTPSTHLVHHRYPHEDWLRSKHLHHSCLYPGSLCKTKCLLPSTGPPSSSASRSHGSPPCSPRASRTPSRRRTVASTCRHPSNRVSWLSVSIASTTHAPSTSAQRVSWAPGMRYGTPSTACSSATTSR